MRRLRNRKRAQQHLIVPHPARPGTLVTFVALPTLLYLMQFVFLAFGTTPGHHLRIIYDPYYRDAEEWRYGGEPDTVNIDDLAAAAAAKLEPGLSVSPGDRAEAVRALAFWTGVCPNYAPFTVPVLAAALQDPEHAVKGAAATGLGSLAGHAVEALPALRAARGTSVNYFDHLLTEAILVIEGGQKWVPDEVCEPLSAEEFAWRMQNPAGMASSVRRQSP